MATKKEIEEHVPKYLQAEEGAVYRKDKSGAIKVSCPDMDPEWYFKQTRIQLNEGVPTGYYGRWYTRHTSDSTLAGLVSKLGGKS